ncbi:MAG: hypothetical protein ACR2FE_00455, partial [Aeromicrobium sp.]
GDGLDLTFRRLAVTPQQIRDHDLQTHDVNTRDSSYAKFVEACTEADLPPSASVELEAFRPSVLRGLVERELYELVENESAWDATIAAEDVDRAMLKDMAARGWSV